MSEVESSAPFRATQVHHFTQTNLSGPSRGHVPALLRRIADRVENLGEVAIKTSCSGPRWHRRELCACGSCAHGING